MTENSKTNKKTVNPNLVAYSRAGDIFHYRWAARRCLRLLDFNGKLKQVTIEGSKELKLGGEYVIDTAEYSIDNDNNQSVEYFQLKHSTVQLKKHFTLSGLKGTIEGFASRFKNLDNRKHNFASIGFTIVTNRSVSDNVKKSIKRLASGKSGGKTFDRTIKKYTGLNKKQLAKFCSKLQFIDGEGNYDAQKHVLHQELSKLTCDAGDTKPLLNLVELVRSRIEPQSTKNDINKEDVLEQFGLTTEKDLFPAPPLFEDVKSPIIREQTDKLHKVIVEEKSSFIIFKAVGGTGKSITCNQLIDCFDNGSLAIAYDCFGNGGYRKISEHRHRICDAYVQVANQLAQQGLCEPIIPINRDIDDKLTRSFLERLKSAVGKLHEFNEHAFLVILFDAVDNAEMAAREFSDRCFATHLLQENLPDGCKIVYLSRPERIHLFNPPNSVPQIEIEPFNINESLQHLNSIYADACLNDATEFRRLTDGNPRVQANAIALGKQSVAEVLSYLGAGSNTVDDLIEEQLKNAIDNVRALYPQSFQYLVDDICTGLATLPPFVPLEVLAAVSATDISAVKSFIADLGRPLWLTDNYVQFRDEPTETWFANTYAATCDQVKTYIRRLEPLADDYSYVAEALPSLLLKSGQYDDLIKLALSEDKLPNENPVDARNIQVYRLQFAFKAALKNKQYADACKLALRAGEEVAGSERQLEILSENLDLTTRFLSEQRVMELAHQRNIRGKWKGSEAIYSASMLSSLPECGGEARSYLRSGLHWLNRYFEERDKEENPNNSDKLEDSDVLAMLFYHYQLNGIESAVDFLESWRPDELIYRVMREFSERLIDASEYAVLKKIAEYGKNCPSLIIAVSQELLKVGRTPSKQTLTRALNKIVGPSKWLDKPKDIFTSYGISANAYLSFLEACIINRLPLTTIRRALNYYIDQPKMYSITEDWHSEHRTNFLRSIALRACIKNNYELSITDVIPKSWQKENSSHQESEELNNACKIVEALLPWYMIRAKLLAGKRISIDKWHGKAKQISNSIVSGRYRDYDPIPFEITSARFFNLMLSKGNINPELNSLIEGIKSGTIEFRHPDKLCALRIANRNSRLQSIADTLEESCYNTLQIVDEDEGPVENANGLILLSRAVLSSSEADAEVYFEKAIEVVSRFGDEAVERWEAVVNIAKHCASSQDLDSEYAYRFMRCAELVGNTVAREKYWDRDQAMATCFKISPTSAFAIASRWNDRNVGRSGRMLSALLQTALYTNAINPSTVWAMAALPFDYDLVDFASQCIEKETSIEKQQLILNDLVKSYRQRGITGCKWQTIDALARTNNLNHAASKELPLLLNKGSEQKESKPLVNFDIDESIQASSRKLYGDINVLSDDGLREALDKIYSQEPPWDIDGFWKYAASKISNSNVVKYLHLIANAEYLDLYKIRSALKAIPRALKGKQGAKKAWPNVIKKIAQRFPEDFVRCYHRRWVLEDIGTDDVTLNAVREGVLEGLSESNGTESAGTFYGFAGSCSQKLANEETKTLFDFALARFEQHIEDGYADGPWRPQLYPPEDILLSITGYIWSFLGSPESYERWCGAHVVRRLYRLGCQQEIDALIEWMSTGNIVAFISNGHPFYIMHAKQYLLIALARCSVDNASLLKKHSKIFSDIALSEADAHILIQKYAAEIALAIAEIAPTAYEKITLQKLKQVGAAASPYPMESTDDYNERRNTPWHKQGTIDTSINLSFSYDFDQYWFKPLADVFKITSKQVEELAAEIVLKKWGHSFPDHIIRDPRQEIWNNRRDRNTWYSHSTYPETDDYNFYLSYHAMLTVAAKLLNAMPVIKYQEWNENVWQDWLERHLLTRNDGFWLADRRGFIPANRREWLNHSLDDDWCWQICPKDFLDVLLFEADSQTWLNTAGTWNNYRDGHNESIEISSRLVPSTASRSLQQVIVHHKHEYMENIRLGDFDEQAHGGLLNQPFKTVKWYTQGDYLDRLDEKDPYAGDLDYPQIMPKEEIASNLETSVNNSHQYWSVSSKDSVALCSHLWSEDKPQHKTDEYLNKGNRLQASLSFLQDLLDVKDMDLVIQVDISRRLTHNHRINDNEVGYLPPSRKVYILSKDGRLRDTKESFKLRETVSKTTK
jgi:hypothetical protein